MDPAKQRGRGTPTRHDPHALRPSLTTTRTPLVDVTTSPENPPCDAPPASAQARQQMARHASEYVHESGKPETGAYHEQHSRLLNLAPVQIAEIVRGPVASPSRAAEAKRCCKLDPRVTFRNARVPAPLES